MATVIPGGMRPPLTYVINYGRQFLDDEANIQAFADAPPGLMHVGKSVPIVHNWGPVRVIQGENNMTGSGSDRGLNWDGIALLEPGGLDARMELLTEYTRQWHDIGVGMLMCYSAIHTICGDHETRRGFWTFYDRWEEYEKWVGLKPKEDPLEWMMIDKQGELVPGACTGFSPPGLAPLHRYRVCPQHPAWRQFHTRLTQLLAEVGYDGVFPDNSAPELHECFCGRCQEGFKEFAKRMSQREREILGVGDVEGVDMMDDEVSAELLRRYRIWITADYQKLVRQAGREVNPEFKVFPNVCSLEDYMGMGEESDFVMLESIYSPGCTLRTAPLDEGEVTIEVVDEAGEEERLECLMNVYDRGKPTMLSGLMKFPRQVEVGKAVEIEFTVEIVGLWFETGEYAHGFELVLAKVETGEEERVGLRPNALIGDPELDEKFQATPVELRAGWTPKAIGRYVLKVSGLHGHVEKGEAEVEARAEAHWVSQYRTHIGQWLFTMNSEAAPILLDYEAREEGQEVVQELHMAQTAAFTNGGAMAAEEEVRQKYHRFFERTRGLYEGMQPWADIGLLYSYWGHNAVTMPVGGHFDPSITPSVDLAGRQRLITVLCDRGLDGESTAGLRSLILCGHKLEMSDEQVAGIRKFGEGGGMVYVYRPETTINGKGYREAVGDVQIWRPGVEVAGSGPLLQGKGIERGLRFSAFVNLAERRMVLHVLNYNVAFREKPAVVTEVGAVTLAVPGPDGVDGAAARVYDPDVDEVVEVDAKGGDGRCSFTLPSVRIYKVVELCW